MRRTFKLLPLLLVVSLTACEREIHDCSFYCFDTMVVVHINGAKKTPYKQINKICENIEALADSHHKRDVVGVYNLNLTNDKVEINKDLYDLLYWTKKSEECAPYFNPLVGSLSKKWKDALDNKQVLSDEVIQAELATISSSSLEISKSDGAYYAQRTGTAQIDLGAIAKGYALYLCQDYLDNDYFFGDGGDYIVNAGSSSVILGKKYSAEDFYTVKISDLSTPSYLHLKEVAISTSGISEQGVKIGDTIYSHIINPTTGSAINNFDTVIVINDVNAYGNAALGDALSTSLMLSTLEEVAQAENDLGVRIIAIKDDEIKYKSESLEIYNE